MPVSEPSKYTTLWSQSGIRFDIPQAADPVTGKAGFDVGFSSINMASEAAGGIPPWGQDFNGILYSLTRACQYVQAGGAPTFDALFAAAVGGYAANAKVTASDGKTVFRCVMNGNTNNPNTDETGWVKEAQDVSDILDLGTCAQRDVGSGAGNVPDMGYFLYGSSSPANGRFSTPGGIVQTGKAGSLSNGDVNITFDAPFDRDYVIVGMHSGTGPAVVYEEFTSHGLGGTKLKITKLDGTPPSAGAIVRWVAVQINL